VVETWGPVPDGASHFTTIKGETRLGEDNTLNVLQVRLSFLTCSASFFASPQSLEKIWRGGRGRKREGGKTDRSILWGNSVTIRLQSLDEIGGSAEDAKKLV